MGDDGGGLGLPPPPPPPPFLSALRPILQPHTIFKPKESRKLFVVPLPEKCVFAVPRTYKLLASLHPYLPPLYLPPLYQTPPMTHPTIPTMRTQGAQAETLPLPPLRALSWWLRGMGVLGVGSRQSNEEYGSVPVARVLLWLHRRVSRREAAV